MPTSTWRVGSFDNVSIGFRRSDDLGHPLTCVLDRAAITLGVNRVAQVALETHCALSAHLARRPLVLRVSFFAFRRERLHTLTSAFKPAYFILYLYIFLRPWFADVAKALLRKARLLDDIE